MSQELRQNLQTIIARIRKDLTRLDAFVRRHPQMFELPEGGACTHGNGRKRGCRVCLKEYMRDYRARKKLDQEVAKMGGMGG
jgi:hypothetical protein